MKSFFKKFDTSSHFPDFWHTAKGQRDNKKIRARKERRILNAGEAQAEIVDDVLEFISDEIHDLAKQFRQ